MSVIYSLLPVCSIQITIPKIYIMDCRTSQLLKIILFSHPYTKKSYAGEVSQQFKSGEEVELADLN